MLLNRAIVPSTRQNAWSELIKLGRCDEIVYAVLHNILVKAPTPKESVINDKEIYDIKDDGLCQSEEDDTEELSFVEEDDKQTFVEERSGETKKAGSYSDLNSDGNAEAIFKRISSEDADQFPGARQNVADLCGECSNTRMRRYW